MGSKWVPGVLVLMVLGLAGWQVYGLLSPRPSLDDPEVLAASTTKTIEERVASLESRVLTLERNTGLVKPKTTGKTKEQYKELAGGRVTSSTWQKIDGSEFTLDASLYGSSVEISWQGWLESGYGSVRLYDSTNYRAVDNSEISVDSGVKSSFYSKPLSIWRGQNQYYIEGRNPWGEPVVVSTPRLKIVTR